MRWRARRSFGLFAALTAAALLSLSVVAAMAEGAEFPMLSLRERLSSVAASGVAVDNACSFHIPPLRDSACTAFEPSAGDVFVTGFLGYSETEENETGPGQKFDISGKLLSPPSPFANEGVPHYGAAVNPANGSLYVANSVSGEIESYNPNTGVKESSFQAVPAFFRTFEEALENVTQIATDSAGHVYVPSPLENMLFEYDPTTCPTPPKPCTPLKTFTGFQRPTGVTVDPSGNVWVADTGSNRIEELSPSGAKEREFKSGGVRALALDEHELPSGQYDVLAIVENSGGFCGVVKSPCDHLVEYSESGTQLADIGAGDFGKPTVQPKQALNESMVAVDDTSGQVYVTDGAKNLVWVFQPPEAPVVDQESAVEVSASEAKLGALVTPGGAHTTYRFEYDTREYMKDEGSHGESIPVPEGSAGESFSPHAVWAAARGLAPGTTYHYRVVVTNRVKSVFGPDETFTTRTFATCSNEQARHGFSAVLPECREYELVTPANKASAEPDITHEHGFLPGGGEFGNYAANNGNRFSYIAEEIMPSSQSAGSEFLATRGASGWSTQSVLPLQPYTGDRCSFLGETHSPTKVLMYSADLSEEVLVVNSFQAEELQACHGEAVEIVRGEPVGEENLLLRNNIDGAYQLINLTPQGVTPTPASVVAASASLSVVVFAERAKLTPEALNDTINLYEWHEGVVHLLKFVLPSGIPVEGSFMGISPNGSEIFFTAGGNLYARLGYGEQTVQLDEKAPGGPGPGGGGSYAAATADGSQVLFTDSAAAGLTGDTAPGTNLYRYDVPTGQLSDLTPVGKEKADAKAHLTGISSEEGSYIYFSSDVLQSGTQTNQYGETAKEGQSNLYLDHNGTITFLMPGEGNGAVISSNGAFLALPGINLYSAADNRFECASCNPIGEPPTAGGVILGSGHSGGIPHSVSNNGQVFFETTEALLPGDINGVTDVYEFDYHRGLHLISTGTSSSGSILLDASTSGNDVFFLTRQKLVREDNSQEAYKVYDARVEGGFPEPTAPEPCTTADACRLAAAPQPSIYGEPASQTFSGAGNITPPVEVKKTPKKKKRGGAKRSSRACGRHNKHGRARCSGRASGKAKSHHGGGGR